MLSRKLAIIFSVLCGFLLAVMIRLNASLGEAIGPMEATWVIHVVGMIAALAVCLYQRQFQWLPRLKTVPWFLLLGGVYGVIMVWLGNIFIPQLGMAISSSIFITVNLISSCVIDHWGWLGMPQTSISWRRIGGVVVAVVGVVLIYL